MTWKRFLDNLGMILLALFLAIVVWIVAIQEQNPIERREFPTTISVQVRNLPPDLILFPALTEKVSLTLRAPQSNWNSLRPDKLTAWVDLSGLRADVYDVQVHVNCTDPNVMVVETKPGTVTVRLHNKISRQVPVQVRLYGSVALGYQMKTGNEDTAIEPETVTITGPETLIEQVDKVTADLYLGGDVKETIVRKLSVVARQVNDDPIGSFVTIEPAAVTIAIPVEQMTGFNEVAVRPVVIGSPAPGYRLTAVSVDPTTVTLAGDPDVVAQIRGFVENVPLDISGAKDDIVERLALKLPEGVSIVGTQGVLVTASIEPLPGRQSVFRKPIVRGLKTDLVAIISPNQVVVTLTGPLPRLNTLTEDDVQIYVDLVDKGIGQYRIEMTYLVPEGLKIESLVPSTVDVVVTMATPTPWPTPTYTPSPTPVITHTVSVSDTATLTITVTPSVTPSPTGRSHSLLPTLTPVPTIRPRP